MDERIKRQILAIRDSGETNMLDIHTVQYLANRKRFYELVIFLEEHPHDYIQFLLAGEN